MALVNIVHTLTKNKIYDGRNYGSKVVYLTNDSGDPDVYILNGKTIDTLRNFILVIIVIVSIIVTIIASEILPAGVFLTLVMLMTIWNWIKRDDNKIK
jgi:hypothetical protein